MTTYSVTNAPFAFGNTSVTQWVGVRAGSYELKVSQIEFTGWNYNHFYVLASAYRYTGATLSGGTAITPAPLREGSAPATATARAGGSVTGTQIRLSSQYTGGSGNPTPGTNPPVNTFGLTMNYPFDLTIAAGSAVAIGIYNYTTGSGASGQGSVTIYFEELRLSWHY